MLPLQEHDMPDPLSDSQITDALKDLPGWTYRDDRLTRAYRLKDFSEALGFIVRIGLLAEQHGHHPELFNVYNTVKVSLNTHDAGGKVTRKDVDLAAAIQTLQG
jgi:4a-hydroxytetrahydrobiopterin dehydratase